MQKASLLYQFVVLQRGFFIVVPFFFRNRLWLFGYSSLFDSSDCRNTAVCWNGGQSIPHRPCRSEQSLETQNSSNLRQSVVPHLLPDEQKYTMLYRIQIFTSAPISILPVFLFFWSLILISGKASRTLDMRFSYSLLNSARYLSFVSQ